MRIEQLSANQPADRFYAGGPQIARFRGQHAEEARRATGRHVAVADHVPEDWVGSVTTLFGEDELGLTRVADGRTLRSHVLADPVGWLGPEHVARYGDDAGLLVKLLDAGQRLPVHAHPDRAFAAEHLGLTHGKTEAWVALGAADVHLAFARDVPADELARWVADQDTAAMLGAMHVLHLEPGDAVLVPAGLPHAIGAGAFVVELQEPTDLSILAEWTGFAIDGARLGHLGLGFDVALGALDRRGWDAAEVEALRGARAGEVGELLPAAADFFRVERWAGPASWEAGYAVVVVTAGAGVLYGAPGSRSVAAGQTWLVPHGAGSLELRGDVEVLRCRPPAV
ncbi:MAG: class I mannose-6-phosphate isomerase [Cellulomonas sp.]|nr:class I mannose-6-phosphate isomerase [Cellulomonas sp.]